MKFLFAIALVFFSYCSFSQESKRIIYVLPDSVEILINNHIINPSTKGFNFYCLIESSSEYNVVTVICYQKKERSIVKDWIMSSNRYVLINNEYLPVLTSYDFKFGTSDSVKIGSFANRDDGYVSRMKLIPHDYYSIKFTDNGSIIQITSE